MHYKTCVSIAEKTPKKLNSVLIKALKKSEYAEIRFDFLKPVQVPEALELIRRHLKRCVCTLRPISEGGKFRILPVFYHSTTILTMSILLHLQWGILEKCLEYFAYILEAHLLMYH
jgi:hypothetical protein